MVVERGAVASRSATNAANSPYTFFGELARVFSESDGGPMVNDQDLINLLLVVSGTMSVTTLIFGALWLRARERALRMMLTSSSAREAPAGEITHLVHAVDAIAVEVERISEAQRFTAQVLAEKIEPEPPLVKRSPGRVITPH
jgi:hypothetical protein